MSSASITLDDDACEWLVVGLFGARSENSSSGGGIRLSSTATSSQAYPALVAVEVGGVSSKPAHASVGLFGDL